jgi:hypothetical protein
MVGSLLERAKAAGFMDDPLVRQAIELESTLDHEVRVDSIKSDLQSAINADDFELLQATVKVAKDNSLGNDPLTLQAEAAIAFILKKRQIVQRLAEAISGNNKDALVEALGVAEAAQYTDTDGAIYFIECDCSFIQALTSLHS